MTHWLEQPSKGKLHVNSDLGFKYSILTPGFQAPKDTSRNLEQTET